MGLKSFLMAARRGLASRGESFLKNKGLFYTVLAIIMACGTLLNYSSTTQVFILSYYEEFAKLIKAGIYRSELYKTAGSFPMWGYGFVFALTHNKVIILLVQQLMNLLVIYSFDSYLLKNYGPGMTHQAYRLLLLFSFPLFFFHAILWPYSFSSSFLLLGLFFLIKYLDQVDAGGRSVILNLILSGVCLGISLNFRSDYLLCIIFIFLVLMIIVLYQRKWNYLQQVLAINLWMLIILIILLPWAFYTKKVTNHYLVNSTNAGHVLYIGLGQLPDNKWKIRPYDDDSSMRHVIETNLHPAVYSTTTYQADSLLKKEWVDKITTDPGEYIKKCVYSFLSVFVQPFAEGDGFKKSLSEEDLSAIREKMRRMQFNSLAVLLWQKASPALLISLFTAIWGILLHLAFWVVIVKNIRKLPGLIQKNKLLLISIIIIFYQVALLAAGYFHRNYNTNIYLLYMVVLLILFYGNKTLQKSEGAK